MRLHVCRSQEEWLACAASSGNPQTSISSDALVDLIIGTAGNISQPSVGASTSEWPVLLVLDMEGFCERTPSALERVLISTAFTFDDAGGANDVEGEDEVIEMPVILLDGATGKERARFHRFIR
jgi:hypothetical protein